MLATFLHTIYTLHDTIHGNEQFSYFIYIGGFYDSSCELLCLFLKFSFLRVRRFGKLKGRTKCTMTSGEMVCGPSFLWGKHMWQASLLLCKHNKKLHKSKTCNLKHETRMIYTQKRIRIKELTGWLDWEDVVWRGNHRCR